ncbi:MULTISPECIES: hypothetical protein [Rhodobacterales]|uniref:hypothetical protein n=1 Tax=Rhodobacterales TaxID=204455 RepID=UPI00058DE2A9|nr:MULTISPECIES: hypothetical protein [Rhodobacterales]KII14877.1 hypothetical protein OO25_10890 [Phaeobacter sp. S60]WGI23093.1 hypothetical protein QBD29_06645 [Amylibacter sp. IMCC11727]
MSDELDFEHKMEAVSQLCVDYWKLTKTTLKAVEAMPEKEARRLRAQLTFSDRQLSLLSNQLGVKVVDFDGEAFHDGIAASADNAGDYADDVELIVSKTIEPAILADMKIIRLGRILVQPVKNEKE